MQTTRVPSGIVFAISRIKLCYFKEVRTLYRGRGRKLIRKNRHKEDLLLAEVAEPWALPARLCTFAIHQHLPKFEIVLIISSLQPRLSTSGMKS